MNELIIFGISTVTALVVTYITRKLATKYRVGEFPDKRKIHKGFMPHMGGFGIYAGFITGIVITKILVPDSFNAILTDYSGILIASVIIIALGAYDDLKGLNAPQKFSVQFLAVTLSLWKSTSRTEPAWASRMNTTRSRILL